jgi:hypothetical protein
MTSSSKRWNISTLVFSQVDRGGISAENVVVEVGNK